jgi:hypothetical protein
MLSTLDENLNTAERLSIGPALSESDRPVWFNACALPWKWQLAEGTQEQAKDRLKGFCFLLLTENSEQTIHDADISLEVLYCSDWNSFSTMRVEPHFQKDFLEGDVV